MNVNRRLFVKTLGATAVLGQFASSRAQVAGANEKLRLAVIGFGGRGKDLIHAIDASPDAKVVALADVDERTLQSFRGDDTTLFRTDDFRRILDRNDIDAIATASPNHWHTPMAMLACQAGKHVYVEKPISHNMHESQAIVAAAERYNRIVQCGFQNRSDTGLTRFFDGMHHGDYGNVVSIHGTCHRSRASIGRLETPLEIPSEVNYELWLGPAADIPIMRPRLHYDWHWDFNTGNGDVGNQGPHEWDLINWALGNPDRLPETMVVAGNRFAWDDAGNTPNVLVCAGMAGDVPILFEVMDLPHGRSAPNDVGVGVIIETEKGHFYGGRGGGKFVANSGETEKFEPDPSQREADGTHDHMQNFIDAVFSSDATQLRAHVGPSAISSSMAHMANISYQLAETAPPEQLEEVFSRSLAERDMLARLRESVLSNALHDRLPDTAPWLLGPPLNFDNEAGQFTGEHSDAANALMTRSYRRGFELPSI